MAPAAPPDGSLRLGSGPSPYRRGDGPCVVSRDRSRGARRIANSRTRPRVDSVRAPRARARGRTHNAGPGRCFPRDFRVLHALALEPRGSRVNRDTCARSGGSRIGACARYARAHGSRRETDPRRGAAPDDVRRPSPDRRRGHARVGRDRAMALARVALITRRASAAAQAAGRAGRRRRRPRAAWRSARSASARLGSTRRSPAG